MKFFLRNLFPITYFRSTRLNRWSLVAYNGLVEWLPAIFLSLYFNDLAASALAKVVLSYIAFISVYEIGYITNDIYSEKYESDPRGRREGFVGEGWPIAGLIIVRILFFCGATHLLGAWSNPFWWGFYISLGVTFALHNLLPSELRIATFFSLSTFRWFAPVILTLPQPVLLILLPSILFTNSVYRTTVYLRSKSESSVKNSPESHRKILFYVACMPLSCFMAVITGSAIPIAVCIYFLFIWLIYWSASKLRP